MVNAIFDRRRQILLVLDGNAEREEFARRFPTRDLGDIRIEPLDVALVAYSPLGRGFLAGRFRTLDDLAPDDWRRNNPRFQHGNFERNAALAERVREMAAAKGCTPAQLALAWLLTREHVIPIPGTSSMERLVENAGAVDVQLTRDELDEIDRRSPKGASAGDRYHASGAALLNG